MITDDEIRSLVISQRLLGTSEIMLIHHTDCGMLTFTDDEVKGQIQEDVGINPCRIGERSSHTWFVLNYLLGYEKVRNYDGSWTEWGNAVRAPIER